MTIETIQKMLAAAPNVEQWWSANKKSIKRTLTLSDLWVNICLMGGLLSVFSTVGFFMANFTVVKNPPIPIVSFAVSTAGAVGSLVLIVSGGWVMRRILQRKYKQASEQWGLDPFTNQKLSDEQRAGIVSELNELILDWAKTDDSMKMTTHQIENIQHLDLPTPWWRKLEKNIASAKEQLRRQLEIPPPSLEDVFVSTTHKDGTTSNVMRL